ncbi:reverse transcriptase-like protein [Virgibacillus salarius]
MLKEKRSIIALLSTEDATSSVNVLHLMPKYTIREGLIIMKVRIQFTYQTPMGANTSFQSEEMKALDAILLVDDMEKTGRVKQLTFIDTQDIAWSQKELKRYFEEIEEEPHDVYIYFDGGFDQQRKKSGLGCVIYYQLNGKSFRIRKNATVGELDSNNEAEYAALHFALKELESLDAQHLQITVRGDSQVVINQLKGEWPCYEKTLSGWAGRIETKLTYQSIEPQYELIPRKNNNEADRLATQALENIEISSKKEV